MGVSEGRRGQEGFRSFCKFRGFERSRDSWVRRARKFDLDLTRVKATPWEKGKGNGIFCATFLDVDKDVGFGKIGFEGKS